MKIYAIADTHGRRKKEKKAIDFASASDLAIVCGDISSFGSSQHTNEFLDALADVAETFVIPGNADPLDITDVIERSRAVSLHAERVEFKGTQFFGYGRGEPALLSLIYSRFGEATKRGVLRANFDRSEEKIYKGLNKVAVEHGVMLTHVPPKGCLDTALQMINIGSASVLRIVKEKKPILHLFGHIHEAVGQYRLGETLLVNCSAGYKGFGCYVDIGEGITVEFLKNS